MGKLIVIEGLDGSGKATQSDLLAEKLVKENLKIKKISFPNYASAASQPIKMYLNGDFGEDPSSINPYAASTFYSVDRFASWKTLWENFYNNDGIVIADRYTTSNIIHQCSKLPKEEWNNYIHWLEDFEYKKIAIPKPDVVIYLDVDPIVSQVLLTKRYSNDEEKKDIHERNLQYLQNCRSVAHWCISNLNWIPIMCTENEKMLPIEKIADNILKITKEII